MNNGGDWGRTTLRASAWRYGCVWFLLPPPMSPTHPCHLRLHKSNQRHVGGPCEVIGLAIAETRRLHPSWLHVSHGLSIFDFQAPDSLHITPRRPLPSIPRGRSWSACVERTENVSADLTSSSRRGGRKQGEAHTLSGMMHHARQTAPPPQRR